MEATVPERMKAEIKCEFGRLELLRKQIVEIAAERDALLRFRTIPSRQHSSAMRSSPRRPSSTMRIFSSAENCRRVARRMSFTTLSAGSFTGPDFCLIFAHHGYDELGLELNKSLDM